MKVFNILYPYDQPLPQGMGDEVSAGAFFGAGNVDELKDCHPDRLRERMEKELNDEERKVLQNNQIDDLQSLLDMKQELMTCRSALEMKNTSIEEKDRKIELLEAELAQLRVNADGGLGSKEGEQLIKMNTELTQ